MCDAKNRKVCLVAKIYSKHYGKMKNMSLTKYEKETIILFNEGEDTAHIQT